LSTWTFSYLICIQCIARKQHKTKCFVNFRKNAHIAFLFIHVSLLQIKYSYFIIYHWNWIECSKWNIHSLSFIHEVDYNYHISLWTLKALGCNTHSKHYISLYIIGLGRYSHYLYTIDTEINRNVSMRTSSCKPTDTDDGDSRKNNDYSGTKTIRFTIDFHAIKQVFFKHIEFYLNYVEHTFF